MDNKELTTHRAKIARLSVATSSDPQIKAMCRSLGYSYAPLSQLATADLGLADLRTVDITAARVSALGDALRKKSPDATAVFLVDEYETQRSAALLKRFGEVIPVGDSFTHVGVRLREILRLRDVAEETGERLKTLTQLHRAVNYPPIASATGLARILMIGTPGAATLAVFNVVAPVAAQCVCVPNAAQAIRAIETQPFDVIIRIANADAEPNLKFGRMLHRLKNAANAIMLEIAPRADTLSQIALRSGEEFMLERQVAGSLGNRVNALARRARLVQSMHGFLRACEGERVRDPASGVFTPMFLNRHCPRLASRADETGRSLSLILLNVRPLKNLRAYQRATKKVGILINRITRAGDITGRLAPDLFSIVLPATNHADALLIADRITGVISNTVYENMETGVPFGVDCCNSVAERKQKEPIEELIARAMVSMRENQKQKAG